LKEAVQSILGQTYADFEFLILDDGSTDNSAELVRTFADPRIRLICAPQSGLPVILNRGGTAARGRYLARMDADDVALPERFALQVAFLDAHPEVAAVGGQAVYLNPDGKIFGPLAKPLLPAEIRKALLEDAALIHPASMIRRAAWYAVGGYRPVFIDAEDYDLWVRLSEVADLANLPEVILQYRVHPGQVTVKRACRQQVYRLAVQASARLRQSNGLDCVSDMKEIGLPELEILGVPRVESETHLLRYIRSFALEALEKGDRTKADAALRQLRTLSARDATPSGNARLAKLGVFLAIRYRRPAAAIAWLVWGGRSFSAVFATLGHILGLSSRGGRQQNPARHER